MSRKLPTRFLASLALLCGAAFAQDPGIPGQSPNPTPGTAGAPGTNPNPSAYPANGSIDSMPGTDRAFSDKIFVKKAAEGSLTEVELGKLAQEKGSSEAVKEFGKKMVDDHTKSSEAIAQVASKVSVEVPSELPKGGRKAKEKLAKLSGPEFDKAYAKLMLNDHREDVDSFTQAARYGTAPDVKEFAVKTLPTLQQHRKMAEELEASVKK